MACLFKGSTLKTHHPPYYPPKTWHKRMYHLKTKLALHPPQYGIRALFPSAFQLFRKFLCIVSATGLRTSFPEFPFCWWSPYVLVDYDVSVVSVILRLSTLSQQACGLCPFFCFPLIAFEWRRHERVVQLHRALCILAESPFMGKIFKGHLGMGTRSVTSCKWCENVCETYELSREIIFSVEGLNFLRWLQRGSEDFIILLGG